LLNKVSLLPVTRMLAMIASMRQLVVRQVEEELVRKLKARAGAHGVSMEEEHRRILRAALLNSKRKRKNFREHLLNIPDAGSDADFRRSPDRGREVLL
jgi:antitoxin FitA